MNKWVTGIDYPEHLTKTSLITLSKGYLLQDESPRAMYRRVAHAAAIALKKPKLEDKFYEYIDKGWLCLATPVASNLGTERGLPISCNSVHVGDSVDSIFNKQHELAMLSKHGAGVGVYFGDIRGRGANITGNGRSEGTIPWMKCYDSVTSAVSQGSVRRGATAIYLPIEHADIEEFLRIRRPEGDPNRQCLNLHHAVTVSDAFMQKVETGDEKARSTWKEISRSRFETGEPYILFTDNVNKANPECYTYNGLSVKTSNICNEIMLHTDVDHSFVCCLSSLNLTKWEEWKNTDLVQTAIWFLDGVLTEYIAKAADKPGFEASVRSAVKGRALGLGALGWHTLLQQKSIGFESFDAMMLNRDVFKHIKEGAEKATIELAKEYGEPEWCKGFKRRNTHLLAVAPTVSNSIISGNVSAGIEPLPANAYAKKTAKGVFIEQNPQLMLLLEKLGKNTPQVWNEIAIKDGSVQHLEFLSDHEREVFKTAYEINQMAIIQQAAQRQKFIDQGQSLNLFFASNTNAKEFHDIHMQAWKLGVKGLYYCRSSSILKADISSRTEDTDCKACES